jgi:hypothetical protein
LDFIRNVEKSVEPRVAEVHVINTELIVNGFILFHKLDKALMGIFNLTGRNSPLHDNLHSSNQTAEILPILKRKKLPEKSRPKPKDVQVPFSGFATTVDFLCRVSRWSVE